ncbi:hypothetical protein H2203_001515 [Taxawa tesnikishii (nom. ined.)]|nr:hypothetical protein H2203_001515 [Dothideales sp. JES 119]
MAKNFVPAALALLGAQGALAGPLSLKSLFARDALSCDNNASNGTTYTSSAGTSYTILCGTDYGGGDLASGQASSFEDCINQCDSTTGCIDVSYVAPMCYMKSTLGTPSSTSYVWTAVSSKMITGQQLCVNGQGNDTSVDIPSTLSSNGTIPMTLLCQIDINGGDMYNVQSTSFKDCMSTCASTQSCVGVAYVAPTCYLKSTVEPGLDYNWVNSAVFTGYWKAYLSSVSAGASGASSGASSAVSSAASGVAAAASGAASAASSAIGTVGSCATTSSTTYSLACGVDYNGQDLSNANTNSFSDCLTLCDETSGCVGVAYVGGANPGVCYMKSSISAGISNSGVDSAARLGGASSGASSAISSAVSGVATAASGAASAVSSAVGTVGSCASTSSTTYSLACGIDYNGEDLSNANTNSFSDCLALCDETSGCVGVAYVGGANPGVCYMKSSISAGISNSGVDSAARLGGASTGATSAVAGAASGVSSAVAGAASGDSGVSGAVSGAVSALTSSSDITCPTNNGSIYPAPNGQNYQILCGVDNAGGDMASASVSSFAQCVQTCANTTGCVDVSFVPPNMCYMKNAIMPSHAASNVWTAVYVNTTSSSGSSSGSATSSGSGLLSGVATGAAGAASSAASGVATAVSGAASGVSGIASGAVASASSCAGIGSTTYTDSTGMSYSLACGVDYNGQDLSNANTNSFADCLTLCDRTSGCKGVAYVGGNNPGVCYMKSSVAAGVANSGVDSAMQLGSSSTGSASGVSSSAAAAASPVASSSAAAGLGGVVSSAAAGVASSVASVASSAAASPVAASSVAASPVAASSVAAAPIASSSTSSAASSSGTAAAYAQCGGTSGLVPWSGPTVCATGYTCVYQSLYYSQCQPIAGSSAAVAASSSAAAPASSAATSAAASVAKTSTTTAALAASSSATSSNGYALGYTQCGGSGWVGPTQCVSGFYCQYQNEFYSQCVLGTASSSSATTAKSSSAAAAPVASSSAAAVKSSTTSAAAAASSSATSSNGYALGYTQCGGSGWVGPTQCVSGFYCQYQNEFYSQCVLGTASSSSATTAKSSTTSAAPVASSTTSSAASAAGTAAGYAQCGGVSYSGPTVCATGFTCVYQSIYYSQCQPASSSSAAVAATTSAAKSSTTSAAAAASSSSTKSSSTAAAPVASSTTSSAASAAGTAAGYAQCGGVSYSGPTVCATGFTCVYQSIYYSQCQPASSSSAAVAASSSKAATTSAAVVASSSTTSAKASSTSSAASTLSTPFYIQIANTNTNTDGKYIVLSSGSSADSIAFTNYKTSATKFVIDSASQNLQEYNAPHANWAGYTQVQTGANGLQKYFFNQFSTSQSYTNCAFYSGVVSGAQVVGCQYAGTSTFALAGVCPNTSLDPYYTATTLIWGSQTTINNSGFTCYWAGLVVVSA